MRQSTSVLAKIIYVNCLSEGRSFSCATTIGIKMAASAVVFEKIPLNA
jgi:hypothetical protein